MNAREIVTALGGRWHGHYGMVPCPAHADLTPSLKVADGENGDVVVHCFGGCNWRDVKNALRRDGLLPDWGERSMPRPDPEVQARRMAEREAEERCRTAAAREIWRKAIPATGTPVEIYLRSRGISLPPPPTIRFHPNLRHGPTGLLFPAMVAAVQGPDGKVTGVHRTFLLPSGGGKAPVSPAKMMLGPCTGAAVRLAVALPRLGISEGIESGLSVMQAAPGLPVWAALSAPGMKALAMPPGVQEVILLADGDDPGDRAAQRAAQEFLRQCKKARIARPPRGMDFNDLLRLPENVVPLDTRQVARHV